MGGNLITILLGTIFWWHSIMFLVAMMVAQLLIFGNIHDKLEKVNEETGLKVIITQHIPVKQLIFP